MPFFKGLPEGPLGRQTQMWAAGFITELGHSPELSARRPQNQASPSGRASNGKARGQVADSGGAGSRRSRRWEAAFEQRGCTVELSAPMPSEPCHPRGCHISQHLRIREMRMDAACLGPFPQPPAALLPPDSGPWVHSGHEGTLAKCRGMSNVWSQKCKSFMGVDWCFIAVASPLAGFERQVAQTLELVCCSSHRSLCFPSYTPLCPP